MTSIAERLWRMYFAVMLNRAWLGWLGVIALLLLAASQIPQFRLDASADSLILENDDDLRFYRELSKRYSESEFLIVTYRPHGDLFADATLARLQALRDELAAHRGIADVTSILDVPLVASPPMSLSQIQQGTRTLLDPTTNRDMAREEFANSPLYRSLLTDVDGEVTAILATLSTDATAQALLQQRESLRAQRQDVGLSAADATRLEDIEQRYKKMSAQRQAEQRELVADVRAILSRYEDNATIFLGGVPMIAADMIRFVEQDLKLFGGLVLVVLVVLLAIAFRQWQWVLIPVTVCGAILAVVVGLIAWRGWPVTVVSSNFTSLTLILSLSLMVHLVVRYRELQRTQPEAGKVAWLQGTLRNKLAPSLFTTLTTMISFASLLIADIRPVIDFGLMMVAAIACAFSFGFLLFPLLAQALPAPASPQEEHDRTEGLVVGLAKLVLRRRTAVLVGYAVLAGIMGVGITRLGVENRFIDYFQEDTEIYQGLVLIDKKLGGTTPLDIIIDAPPSFYEEQALFAEEFGDDFGSGGISGSSYWFNRFALERVDAIHRYLDALPETGKVLSMASTMGLLEQLNNNEPLDNFSLAILYNRVSPDIKKTLFDPYLGPDGNEVRFSLRVIDSDKNLNRNDLLKKIHQDLLTQFELQPEQLRLAGALVLYNNVLQSLFSSQIMTLGLVFAAITFMLAALFRSLRYALIGIIPTLLTAGTILGLMGWLGIPLDIMTITIAAITIGIGVDDTIHYLHRYREEQARVDEFGVAILRSHASVGRSIFLTSVIVTAGFSVLSFSSFTPIILFGLLTGLAMLLAFVANLTLLPALLRPR